MRRWPGEADPNSCHRVDFDPLKGPPMRIVGGSARGKKLLVVPGDGTQPILDRVKTALFDILRPRIAGMEVLDLFAGSGSVGIEALSQGAAHSPSSIAARRPSPRSSGTSRPPVFPTARRPANGRPGLSAGDGSGVRSDLRRPPPVQGPLGGGHAPDRRAARSVAQAVRGDREEPDAPGWRSSRSIPGSTRAWISASCARSVRSDTGTACSSSSSSRADPCPGKGCNAPRRLAY